MSNVTVVVTEQGSQYITQSVSRAVGTYLTEPAVTCNETK